MAKHVKIHDGRFRNSVITGTFTVSRDYKKSWSTVDGPKSGKITVLDPAGMEVSVWVNEEDFDYLTDGVAVNHKDKQCVEMSDEEMDLLIRERFETLKRMGCGVADGYIRSLIVSGSPGIGKTHELEAILLEAERTGKIDGYVSFSGSAGAVGLYKELFNYSGEKDVIVLDDMDKLFYDLDAINVLKAALDSKDVRKISWLKDSRTLRDDDIPNSFEFKGSVIFITNEDFNARIAKNDKLSEHMKAFMSRSSYLDLAIHSVPAVLMRVKQVVMDSQMLEKKGLTYDQKVDMLDWLSDNRDRLMTVDLRSCVKIANYMAMDNDNWMKTAADCLLKPMFKA